MNTERIWRELSDRLRRFVQSRISSAADVDDILQAVFLRIHQKIDGLRQAERLESWVFQIARNAVTDYFRGKRTTENNVSDLAVEPDSIGRENLNSEIAECVATLIDQLPDDQRSALSMYELQGLSQKAIAEHESISLSGAKSRIQRGRQNLETILHKCCQFQFDTRGNVVEYEPVNDECCDGKCN